VKRFTYANGGDCSIRVFALLVPLTGRLVEEKGIFRMHPFIVVLVTPKEIYQFFYPLFASLYAI